jgi:NAD/NADP transhydrogenase beta subunit
MAVAQAWHAVRETADTLKKEGVEVFIKRSLASGFAGIDKIPRTVATTPRCCPATPRR